MRAKVEAGSDDFDKIAQFCYSEFRAGRGVSIGIAAERKIYLVPLYLVERDKAGLIIVDSRGAAHIFNGGEELNEFVLVQRGFSLQTGKHVAKIVNALIEHYGWGSSNPKREVPLAQLTHQKGESNES